MINEADYISLIPLNSGELKNEAGVNRFYSIEERFKILVETIKEQRAVLDKVDYLKSIKKLSNETYTSMESNKQL